MVQDFGDKKGVIGFTVCTPRHKAVYDNAYMKTYAAIQERGLPLVFHGAFGGGERSEPQAVQPLHRRACAGLHLVQHPALHQLAGERHARALPEAQDGLGRSGLAWMPFLMQRLDNEWMMRSSEVPLLKRKPRDYMREMYYSTQPMEMVDNREALELTFKMINAETQLLYSSDYPHWDMDLPSTIYDLPFLTEQPSATSSAATPSASSISSR